MVNVFRPGSKLLRDHVKDRNSLYDEMLAETLKLALVWPFGTDSRRNLWKEILSVSVFLKTATDTTLKVRIFVNI